MWNAIKNYDPKLTTLEAWCLIAWTLFAIGAIAYQPAMAYRETCRDSARAPRARIRGHLGVATMPPDAKPIIVNGKLVGYIGCEVVR